MLSPALIWSTEESVRNIAGYFPFTYCKPGLPQVMNARLMNTHTYEQGPIHKSGIKSESVFKKNTA